MAVSLPLLDGPNGLTFFARPDRTIPVGESGEANGQEVRVVSATLATADGSTVFGTWCGCGYSGDAPEVYFHRPDGSHGWACRTCRGITQAG